jgi:anti-sigma regulatory factor (Ser/Thr protein kinase)
MADVKRSEQDAVQYIPCHGLVDDHWKFDIDPRRDQKELPVNASPDGWRASRSSVGDPWPDVGGPQHTTGLVLSVPARERASRHAASPVPPLHPSGGAMFGEWPRQSFLELGALPGAVPCARLHARQLTWEWGLAGLSEDVELLVSELITNAVRASRSLPRPWPVRLWLLADTQQVLILVWDASEQEPVRADADADIESGRGLLLVDAMSSKWDWYSTKDMGGKIVWALVQASR